MAHLNSAGAALPTAATLATVIAHLELEARPGRVRGGGGRGRPARRCPGLGGPRCSGADADEVAVTGSDTEGWTKALWGLALGGGLPAGRRILVDRQSYDSHYMGLLQVCAVTGATIEVVPAARRRDHRPRRAGRRARPSATWPW